MSVGLAAQIATTKTTIAGLTPATVISGISTGFTLSGDDLALDDDGRTLERHFNVYAGTPGIIVDPVAHDAADFTARMLVEVRYDDAAQRDDGDGRILEDAEQIAFRVHAATPASGVKLVAGGAPEIFQAGASRHFRILRIPFDVRYTRTF